MSAGQAKPVKAPPPSDLAPLPAGMTQSSLLLEPWAAVVMVPVEPSHELHVWRFQPGLYEPTAQMVAVWDTATQP